MNIDKDVLKNFEHSKYDYFAKISQLAAPTLCNLLASLFKLSNAS